LALESYRRPGASSFPADAQSAIWLSGAIRPMRQRRHSMPDELRSKIAARTIPVQGGPSWPGPNAPLRERGLELMTDSCAAVAAHDSACRGNGARARRAKRARRTGRWPY
jgi:hypothetical protein